jgi:hypothetical protein
MRVVAIIFFVSRAGSRKIACSQRSLPNGSAYFAGPRMATVITAFIFHVLCSKQLVSLLHLTFSKGYVFPLRVTNNRPCIPLLFSHSKFFTLLLRNKALHHSFFSS